MRSTRYIKGAVVAAACAALLVPAGAANAASGPGSAPSDKGGSAGTPQGNPTSAAAKAAGVCDDAVEVGERDLIKRGSETIASVKQYYSKECKENYGYVWIWDSFHNGADPYDVSVGVYRDEDDTTHGKRTWKDTTRQEFWSHGTNTVSDCTQGYGAVSPGDDPRTYEGFSERRC